MLSAPQLIVTAVTSEQVPTSERGGLSSPEKWRLKSLRPMNSGEQAKRFGCSPFGNHRRQQRTGADWRQPVNRTLGTDQRSLARVLIVGSEKNPTSRNKSSRLVAIKATAARSAGRNSKRGSQRDRFLSLEIISGNAARLRRSRSCSAIFLASRSWASLSMSSRTFILRDSQGLRTNQKSPLPAIEWQSRVQGRLLHSKVDTRGTSRPGRARRRVRDSLLRFYAERRLRSITPTPKRGENLGQDGRRQHGDDRRDQGKFGYRFVSPRDSRQLQASRLKSICKPELIEQLAT